MTSSPTHLDRDAVTEHSTHGPAGDQLYRAIFEASREGLFIGGADGRILEANPSLEAMLGFGDVVGSLVHDVSPELWRIVASAVTGARPARTKHRRADGTTFEAEVTYRPIPYGTDMATLVAVRDITRQVRVEQVLEDRVAERT
ncbi:MAG: PAS domain S-box protein, partial [Pirellulaceae bacterium]